MSGIFRRELWSGLSWILASQVVQTRIRTALTKVLLFRAGIPACPSLPKRSLFVISILHPIYHVCASRYSFVSDIIYIIGFDDRGLVNFLNIG
jgi:hypothetical protein